MTQAVVSMSCVQAVTGRWMAWRQLERCPADRPSPFPSKLIAERLRQKLVILHSEQEQVCTAPWVTVQAPGNPFSSQVPLNHTREMLDEPSPGQRERRRGGGLGQQRATGGPELYFTSGASSQGGSEPWLL